MINCATQEEIDYYWEKLSADCGKEVEYGYVAGRAAARRRDAYGFLNLNSSFIPFLIPASFEPR
jgi:hypothetical protein